MKWALCDMTILSEVRQVQLGNVSTEFLPSRVFLIERRCTVSNSELSHSRCIKRETCNRKSMPFMEPDSQSE